MDYTLGFLFQYDYRKELYFTWLIKKTRPDWQKGKYNGIGGKVEKDESFIDTMVREFREETSCTIEDWKRFCVLTDNKSFNVHCYSSFIPKSSTIKTTTDEEIKMFYINDLPLNIIPNVRWLIPMALSFNLGEKADHFIILEKYDSIYKS